MPDGAPGVQGWASARRAWAERLTDRCDRHLLRRRSGMTVPRCACCGSEYFAPGDLAANPKMPAGGLWRHPTLPGPWLATRARPAEACRPYRLRWPSPPWLAAAARHPAWRPRWRIHALAHGYVTMAVMLRALWADALRSLGRRQRQRRYPAPMHRESISATSGPSEALSSHCSDAARLTELKSCRPSAPG